jgi:hypothetical protein
MLALVLAIGAEAGWIIFDVAVSVVTYPLLPSKEWWALVVSGAALVILTIVARILEFRGGERVARQHFQEHDILASSSLKILAQLQNVTQTSGEPVVKTIEMATAKIETLEQQIRALEQAVRRITAEQRRKFRESLNSKTPYVWETFCVAFDSEAHGYAEQLNRMFREAGMRTGYSVSADIDSPTLDQFGLTIHHKTGEFPDDARALAWAFDQAGIK